RCHSSVFAIVLYGPGWPKELVKTGERSDAHIGVSLSEAVDSPVSRSDHHTTGGDRRRTGDGRAGAKPPLFPSRGGVEDLQTSVTRSHVDPACGNRRGRGDAGLRHELPDALTAHRADRVDRL